MSSNLNLLTKEEDITLSSREQVIERGLKTFVEVGEALITIRDGRLYRASHGTFEAYCSERWGMSRFYAHRIIDAAEVSEMLPMGNTESITERQVRPLTPLKDTPELAVAAWEDAQALASEEGLPAPVARHVEAAAAPYREALKESETEAQKAEAEKQLSMFEGAGQSRHFNYQTQEPATAPQKPATPTEIIEKVRGEKTVHVTQNSGENEWYTPLEYLEAARQVLGSIELDPASSAFANKNVQAKRIFTIEDDGLLQPWEAATLWMNPPYSSDLIRLFTCKLAEHVQSGEVQEAIVLVNNATETRWFAELVPACSAVVFPTGRIRYLDPQGNPANSPLQGQAFLYAGKNAGKFLEVFGRFGWSARMEVENGSR